jgi:hypothetical protein
MGEVKRKIEREKYRKGKSQKKRVRKNEGEKRERVCVRQRKRRMEG